MNTKVRTDAELRWVKYVIWFEGEHKFSRQFTNLFHQPSLILLQLHLYYSIYMPDTFSRIIPWNSNQALPSMCAQRTFFYHAFPMEYILLLQLLIYRPQIAWVRLEGQSAVTSSQWPSLIPSSKKQINTTHYSQRRDFMNNLKKPK